MFCTECGQKLPPNAHYCFKCGAKTINDTNVTLAAPTNVDCVAEKAEEFVSDDVTMFWGGDNAIDDVAPKAAFLDENADENTPPISHNDNELGYYTETRETFLVDYLYKIKRENAVIHSVVYCLYDSKLMRQSEWFDNIYYAGYDVFIIERERMQGLMEYSLQTYQLWDKLLNISTGVYGAQIGKQWILVVTKNHKIEILNQYSYNNIDKINNDCVVVSKNDKMCFVCFDSDTNKVINLVPCEFDNISNCKDGVFIVKKNNKYGYVFHESNNKYDYCIRCSLDSASPFSITDYDEPMAEVIYNGKSYLLDKKGDLWERRLFVFNEDLIYLILGSAFLALGATGLYTMIDTGCSFKDAMSSSDNIGIFAAVFVICIIIFILIKARHIVPSKISLNRQYKSKNE